MKYLGLILITLFLQIPVYSQQGRTIVAKSDVREVYFRIPEANLQIVDLLFSDQDDNTGIEQGELVKLTFGIENTGTKAAEEVLIRVSIITPDPYAEKNILTDTAGNIAQNTKMTLILSLAGVSDMNTNPVKIRVYTTDKKGHDAFCDGEIFIGQKQEEENSISLPDVLPENLNKPDNP